MKKNIKGLIAILAILVIVISACKKQDYSMGDLTAPSDIVITADVIGQDATHPNGDGSGDVRFTVTGNNVLSYKIDYDANTPADFVYIPSGIVTKKFTNLGLNTYLVTVIAYGKGGTSTTVTKEVTVRSDFTPAQSIIDNLTGGTSKTWVVDKSIPAHFGVGPWDAGSIRPEWWSASINEKVACCNCFYTAAFKFNKIAASNSYSLEVTSPDGAFTKTGALTSLPGIPAGGDEGCYAYGGGTSAFSFIPASSGAPTAPSIPSNSGSTQTSILLAGNNTYIGYGSLQKEYEILSITPTAMYLRVQGTETGNAWYLKLKAL